MIRKERSCPPPLTFLAPICLESSGFPKCQKCATGDLVPLSDFGSQGAAIHYKAWVCTNPDCGFNLKIRNGDLYIDEPISSGAVHQPRYAR